MPHHREVLLQLKGDRVVAIPDIIGVQTGDVVEFKSKDGEPDITYEPSGAVKLDPKEGSERITVLQAPFEFYCRLIVNGKSIGWRTGGGMAGGGIGILDPPDVAVINPTDLPQGSSDTVVTVTGAGFYSGSTGLVNGSPRFIQYVDSTTVRITVTAADLAKPGLLQIAVKNVTASNSKTLTVS